ncbi:carboxypeptidase-like regulatory domain-containing protein [Flavobacterium bizetiae]|uniref:carboxypeptidase-like regulatory domain-containing protein n=1 Tax=Flavobacterium bizetiae TaxID=2704140 RepID=UPI0021E7EF72|nr:carboxypeptidase-like regulatory domain-containing protein [Flavobacterium bizetiae]UTN02344.1 carboxypeptidase-like regulatory domain-containing protein [Flavobacterium bizetiae]
MNRKLLLTLLLVSILTSCTKKPGTLTGNVYWKYNDYVGNKPDASSKVNLYSITDKNITFETSTDVAGNYKIEEIPPGKYLLVIRSGNTTDSPKDHLNNLSNHAIDIKTVFGFDIQTLKKEIKEIDNLEQEYQDVLVSEDKGTYESLTRKIDKYEKIKKEFENKSSNLISKFPSDFKSKIDLYSGYDKSLHFANIEIKEQKTTNENVDFGITYR